MNLAWLTDLHLEFTGPGELESLSAAVRHERPDAVLVGGDTGTASTFARYLQDLADAVGVPLYFVLGNHDAYEGSIARARTLAARISQQSGHARWLTTAGVVSLTPRTALVGHDGWADGRLGSRGNSPVMLNDYRLIEELSGIGRPERFWRLAALGDESAEHFRRVLPEALADHERVILLTHVPPFRESCWHEGKISDDDWLPHFSNAAAGTALREIMSTRPDRHLTVLCGHTHSRGICHPLPNVVVKTGGVRYGEPRVQEVLDVD